MPVDGNDLKEAIKAKYMPARVKYGPSPRQLFTALKGEVKDGNIRAIETTIKLDEEWPTEKQELTHKVDNLAQLASQIFNQHRGSNGGDKSSD